MIDLKRLFSGALTAGIASALLVAPRPLTAQTPVVERIEVRPASVTLDVNGTATVTATAHDAAGRRLDVPITFFSSNRRAVRVDSTGAVTALQPGTYQIFAGVVGQERQIRATVEVTVNWPAIQSVAIEAPGRLYTGTTVRHRARVTDATGAVRTNVTVQWRSDNPAIASVDAFGDVLAHQTGRVTLFASAGGVTGSHQVTVVANPARRIEITASAEGGRTGDVIRFTSSARDAAGAVVPDMPVVFALKAAVEDTVIAPGGAASIDAEGRFVAQRAGDYTVVATVGGLAAQKTVGITHRFTSTRLESGKGHGAVTEVHTSDLWVWEGKDGKDYAVTGTWGGNGVAYFWDVSDPAAPVLTDSVVVDARTVNDVKVDAERGLCVISREGASNRRNGFVVLDCSNPRNVQVLSRYDDDLVGGVHNVFLYRNHIFAINAGRRFDIISLEDPRAPRRVSFYEHPGEFGIHDVWVDDGIAYASQWGAGVVLVDVGNGVAGGSLDNPVFISNYAYPIGRTHAAYPYRSPSSGKLYLFLGDEIFPYGLNTEGVNEAGGYIHIVDFTDLRNPKEVARYQVPEAGPHNLWVENDTLYAAYYNAGLRVVDVSGELAGNLYDQGRELARFQPFDPGSKIPNAPFVWGPQPHKGHVFISDWNSGLWSVKLPERPRAPIP